MFGIPRKTLFAYLVAAFFIVGGLGNILAPSGVRADYLRWGYPDWFHFVTGGLEWVTAVLLVGSASRLPGVALGILLMCAAAGTVILHNEYPHALAPFAVICALALVGWTNRPQAALEGSRPY